MQNTTDVYLWLRLMLTDGVGNRTARKLLTKFGPPESIFSASFSDLNDFAGIKLAQALKIEPKNLNTIWSKTQAWMEQSLQDGWMRSVVCLGDTAYPATLLNMVDPPCMLYALGQLKFMEEHDAQQSLAMVGSRSPSAQGLQSARAFALNLSQSGLCIVSGLAHGIDTAAHTGALENLTHPCPTLAVVGTGLDRVYPRQNQALARQIAAKGLLISEYPIGTPPMASNFPKRNRLIAGLSRGTLVVEATLESGSLITARLANEQGKDVFAIPGSIHTPHARGCHALIREGAKLVETSQDILEEWGSTNHNTIAPKFSVPTNVNPPTHPLLTLMGAEPIELDLLQARSGIPTEQLQVQLLELELDGLIGRLPGQRFQLLGFI